MYTLCVFVQIYIVSGGHSGSSLLASTEILEKDGGSAWQYVASLPEARQGVRGLGLDNGRFIITANTEVLLYNSEEDEWSTVGHLSTPRYFHGMSLVPGSTMDFCF